MIARHDETRIVQDENYHLSMVICQLTIHELKLSVH